EQQTDYKDYKVDLKRMPNGAKVDCGPDNK
uniref:Uncharacterized protein n=1 Tax=Caenorhabditis japonica TaxID=281687 RepID=A0A8R1EGJ5_CAEJA